MIKVKRLNKVLSIESKDYDRYKRDGYYKIDGKGNYVDKADTVDDMKKEIAKYKKQLKQMQKPLV